MAEKKSKAESETEQLGLRLNRDGLRRLRAYAEANPFKPSLTRLIDMAIVEWLHNHRDDPHMPDDAKPKSKK